MDDNRTRIGPNVMPISSFEIATSLGEGPLWDARAAVLLIVDADEGQIIAWEASTGNTRECRLAGAAVTSLVPLAGGGFLGVTADALLTISADVARSVPWLDVVVRPDATLNDSACDKWGRLWVGSIDERDRRRRGQVWRIDPDGRARVGLSGLRCANGIGWSPDGREMYVVESRDRRLYSWQFDPELGPVGPRRILRQFSRAEGKPDGLAVDVDGGVWVAMWDGWAIRRIGPGVHVEEVYRLPVARVTSCAFGGSEMKTLFVTTASHGLTEADRVMQPDAGRVFALHTDVAGLPVLEFAPLR